MGAFVLPNKEIPDQADLRGFVMPGMSPFRVVLAGP
jgi:hypothetical protein